jgi:hypothetical protein
MLVYYESPFHVTYPKHIADEMCAKVDLCIALEEHWGAKGWSNAEICENTGLSVEVVLAIKRADIEVMVGSDWNEFYLAFLKEKS